MFRDGPCMNRRFRKSAASEARTHDRRIMRPACCQLCYRCCSCPGIALRWRVPTACCHEGLTAAASMEICMRSACMSKEPPGVRSALVGFEPTIACASSANGTKEAGAGGRAPPDMNIKAGQCPRCPGCAARVTAIVGTAIMAGSRD